MTPRCDEVGRVAHAAAYAPENVKVGRRSLSLFLRSVAVTVVAGAALTAIMCGRWARSRAASTSIVPATADLHAGNDRLLSPSPVR